MPQVDDAIIEVVNSGRIPMRLPLGINLVHIASPELVKAVFGGDNDVLRAGEGAIAAILEPLFGPHSVGVLDGPEHLRQRKLIMPAFATLCTATLPVIGS